MEKEITMTTNSGSPMGKHGSPDLTIKVGEQEFRVHKAILSANSEYFRAMFSSSMEESNKASIELREMSAKLVDILINFIYTGEIKATEETVEDILEKAIYFEISSAIKACTNIIVGNLTSEQCFDIISLFESYSLWEAVKEVQLYIISNIQKIKGYSPENRSHKHFCLLIDNWPDSTSEWELFQFVKKWVESDFDDRKEHLDDVMTRVRFCLMTEPELRSIQKLEVYVESVGSWPSLVKDALKYNYLPTHHKVLYDNEQNRVRPKPTPVCFPWDLDDPEPFFFALDKDGHWMRSKKCKMEEEGPDQVVASITVNGFLIVSICLTCTGNQEWRIIDPRTLIWSDMATLKGSRRFFSLVQYGKHLYTIGGEDDLSEEECNIDRYSFRTDSWSPVFRLPQPLVFHAACVYRDCIYISGGNHFYSGPAVSTVSCLNLTTRKWETKSPLLEPFSQHKMGVMKLHQEDVIYIIDRHFQFEYYNMAIDQWSKCTFTFTKNLPDTILGEVMLTRGNSVFFLDVDHTIPHRKSLCIKAVIPEQGNNVSIETLAFVPSQVHGTASDGLYPFGGILSVPAHLLVDTHQQ